MMYDDANHGLMKVGLEKDFSLEFGQQRMNPLKSLSQVESVDSSFVSSHTSLVIDVEETRELFHNQTMRIEPWRSRTS